MPYGDAGSPRLVPALTAVRIGSVLQHLGPKADQDEVTVELEDREQREVGRKARVAVLDAVRTLGGRGTRREILATASRDGGFTERELKALAPEHAREKYKTFVEYRLSWSLTNLKSDGLLENPKWGMWRLAGAAVREPTPLVAERVGAQRLAELRAMPYREYLRAPEWRRTRAAALDRADHRCSLDRAHVDRLEVHHNTYDRLGAELASDLVVLCHSCHHLYHDAYGLPRRPKHEPTISHVSRTGSIPPPSDTTQKGSQVGSRPSGIKLATRGATRRTLLHRIFTGTSRGS